MELIDKQKLLESINKSANEIYNIGNCGHVAAGVLVIVRDEIESGKFNDHSAQEEIERQHRLLDNEVEIKERLREEIAKLKEERNALLEGLKQIAEFKKGDALIYVQEIKDIARSIIAKIEGEDIGPFKPIKEVSPT